MSEKMHRKDFIRADFPTASIGLRKSFESKQTGLRKTKKTAGLRAGYFTLYILHSALNCNK
jgi:hypothetical protein